MKFRDPIPDPSFVGYTEALFSSSDGTAAGTLETLTFEPAPTAAAPPMEIGTDVALGFMPHDGENRKERLKQVALFVHTEDPGARRRYVKQRARKQRGVLDIETRRLQRKALNGKA